MQPITVLSVAGSDSGGGAGIQADLRTFAAFGVHGTTALTALTAQNTLGVTAVVEVAPDDVEAQVRAVVDDFEVRAVKTGMLAHPSTVERVGELARAGLLPHLVVDPVLVATSGDVLMADGGVRAYREALFPYAEVVTPNLREAAVLAGVDLEDVRDLDDVAALARRLVDLGARHVLVKGGHPARDAAADRAADLLVSAEGLIVLDAVRVVTANDHGTGCSLSAALAAGLGLGRDVADATRDAKAFVLSALEGASSWRLGRGRGPIDHLGWGGE